MNQPREHNRYRMEREELNYYLQKAPEHDVSRLCREIEQKATVQLIQKPTPQTLLVPVRDPINDGEFHGGEVLVTSAIVTVDNINGWAMVMDDNPETATRLAILDGAFAAGLCVDAILQLGEQGRHAYDQKKQQVNRQVAATKVAFDLL